MKSNPRLVWFALSTILLCALLGSMYGSRVEATNEGLLETSAQANRKQFRRVYDLVAANYATPLKPDQAIFGPTNSMTVGAIPGMLRTLDPHSNFFDPKAFEALRLDQEGRYYGVGMYIQLGLGPSNTIVPTVIYPLPGSPAMRAGLKAHDLIVRVDGKPTAGLNIASVADMLRGPEGTVAHVTVSRIGYPKPLQFSIQRAAIKESSVDVAFMVRPGIGYIHIRSFDETTNRELTKTLAQMGAHHLRGLVLDLRENPGGLLSEAVAVAGHFLQRGQLIVYHYGQNSPEQRYYAPGSNDNNNYPMVVLIDHNTASAAEIVTGALQDHDRALVMGQTSFGKGLVQTVYLLSDHAALALTTAHYYTPSGRLIQRSYSGLSLLDYFNQYGPTATSTKEVYYTDGGRKVYGGGGITPDVVFQDPSLTNFDRNLLVHFAFFRFAKEYAASHKAIPRDFQPDQEVLNEFEKFLAQRKIAATDKELQANRDYITSQISQYVLSDVYGGQEINQLSKEDDPMVQKAISELPAAEQLAQNAKRYMASRGAN
jgi:carboxyl-terminal processing protease